MCKTLGIPHHHEFCGEAADVDAQRVAEILSNDPSFTHVSVVHCETSTGIFNNVEKIGEAVKKHAPSKYANSRYGKGFFVKKVCQPWPRNILVGLLFENLWGISPLFQNSKKQHCIKW